MCVQASRVGRARTDHLGSVWPAFAWLQLASHPSPFWPIRSAGGSDIDNASKPVAPPRGAGMDAVGWQPPEKSKRISASQTRRHQSRSSGPGQDRTGSQGWDRAGHGVRIQTTKPNNGRVLNRASADAVSPRRHRHSRYMLCIIPIMCVLWSSAIDGESVTSSLPLDVCICPRITSCVIPSWRTNPCGKIFHIPWDNPLLDDPLLLGIDSWASSLFCPSRT